MHLHTLRAATFISALTMLASPARAVTYTATLLDPVGTTDARSVGVSNAIQVGSGYGPISSGSPHAFLWTGTAGTAVDLHPALYTSSYAISAANSFPGASNPTDTKQVGNGTGPPTGGNTHALLWSGTAASYVDLNPSDIDVSYARDIACSGTNCDVSKQVGDGFDTNQFLSHALLWSGTAASKVDLNPAGYDESFAYGVSGSSALGFAQAGYGNSNTLTNDHTHALMWTGSAASVVDLNPVDFTDSVANDIYFDASGKQVVGSGGGPDVSATNGETHAMLWKVDPLGAVTKFDLNPSGFSFSEAIGASAAGQVGDGFGDATDTFYHALYWNGAAGTAVDLHNSLIAFTTYNFTSSQAFAISDNGTIVGLANDDNQHEHAIVWTPDSGIDGDYNNNGKVDAGDYVTWRKGTPYLHNKVSTIGPSTPADYTEWRARFDNPLGSGAGLTGASIPEPTSFALFACSLFLMSLVRANRPR